MFHQKYVRLQEILREAEAVSVAFSGGTDSAFLLAAAHAVLGERVIAVTAKSCIFPASEQQEAEEFCRSRGIRQLFIDTEFPDPEAFRRNPPDRCYHCKLALFRAIRELAAKNGFPVVADGTNCDDTGDYRPGMRAIAELGIRSPLREAGLHKPEIRALSREMHLPTWDRPSAACLASRIPYGEPVTAEKVRMVDAAETFLRERGFRQVRVRMQSKAARIELLPEDIPSAVMHREEIAKKLRKIGFSYISLDMEGYRTGSLNETIPINDIPEFT